MKRKIISIMAIAVLGMAGIADAAPDSNSIVKDNIEYYIQTDKSGYHLGEQVEMLYRVTNLRDEDVTFGFPGSPEWNFWVERDGENIWTAVEGWYWVGSGFTLAPSEYKEYPYLWDMRDHENNLLVNVGGYSVIGGLDGAATEFYDFTRISVGIKIVPEPPKTYYVNAAEGSDNNDGLSPQTPFATIQKAIDSAFNGDTVLVADGTYTGPGNRDIDFRGKAITVRSESGPNNCIIDCQRAGRGFNFDDGEDANSVLDGFTITKGYAYDGGAIYCYENSSPTINNCIISGNSARAGGGMGNDESNPTVINCTFSGNSAYAGGGIDNDRSSPTVTNCTFTKNSAEGHGGGMENRNRSSPTVTNCTFSGNSSSGFGGGMENDHLISPTITNCTFSGNSARWGGGVYNFGRSSPTLTNCTFSGNSASYYGGGMYNGHESNPTLTNCTFTSNSADRWGGGMYNNSGSPTVTNCTFSGNSADGHGGGMYNDYSIVTLTNCTFSGNSADWGGGMYNRDSSPNLTNCTFSGNTAKGWGLVRCGGGGIYCEGDLGLSSSPIISNCIITGNSSDDAGGGIFCVDSSLTISNSTISSNLAKFVGGGICYGYSNTTIANCILWGNEAPNGPELYLAEDSNALVNYTDVQGDQNDVYIGQDCTLNWGLGNIDADPCFVDPGYWDVNDLWVDGDYYLLPNSLCIDAGDPDYLPEPDETDIDGNPRVIGDAIDMGAYETNYIQAARLLLLPRALNRRSRQPRVMALVRLPQGITKDQIDSDTALILYPGGIKAMRQFVIQNRRHEAQRVSIFAFFNKAELMDAIDDNGRVQLQVLGAGASPVRLEICFDREAFCETITETGEIEITVIGSLTTSRYFYATDTIKIKP